MASIKKEPRPYGLIVLGLGLITLSALFMVMRGQLLPGQLFSEQQAGRSSAPQYDSGVARDVTGLKQGDSFLPPLPMRGVPSGTPRKVTKNASLELVVDHAERASDKIKLIADFYGGFVTASQLYDRGNTKIGTITVRVPAGEFEQALREIKAIALEVKKETIHADDVTEQYVDLEARLKNLEAQEDRYLAILKKAKTVEDTLKVTQYLNQVRSEIDQITGQLEYLKNQVAMSSITISLLTKEDVEVFGIRWQPLLTLKESFRSMLEGIAGYVNAIIALFFYLPALLLWGATVFVALYAGWIITRKLRK